MFEGLLHLFTGRHEGESRFDVSLKYWKLSPKTKNKTVNNCFYATLILIKNDLFSEKLQKLGTSLDI